MKEDILDNSPISNAMWRGLGGNFDNITQIVNELLDNSISNALGNSHKLNGMNINIKLYEISNSKVCLQIIDNGSGIKNLNSAFSLGSQDSKDSPLNEHGYGMKQSISAANPDNDDWCILTKRINGDYYYIGAPFDVNKQKVRISSNINDFKNDIRKLPDNLSHGTIVQFNISKELLRTVSRGVSGNYQNLVPLAELLREDLCYTYGPIIEKHPISIFLSVYNKEGKLVKNILPVSKLSLPEYMPIGPGEGTILLSETDKNLNENEIDKNDAKVHYRFMNLTSNKKENKKHYLANMSTSGVEVRINGRLIKDNIFSEIWHKAKHNSYNNLLIQIDIESNDGSKLPKTFTTKTNIDGNDHRFNNLKTWIHDQLPKPKVSIEKATDEIDLFEALRDKHKDTFDNAGINSIVSTEQMVFNEISGEVRLDMYEVVNNIVTLYEGKINTNKELDLYQLMMGWDGLAIDGTKADRAILVLPNIPEKIKKLVEYQNNRTDILGERKYNIIVKTWDDLLPDNNLYNKHNIKKRR